MLCVSSEILVAALAIAGAFTVALGVVHIAIPVLMDFDHAIPTARTEPARLRSLAVGGFHYEVLRSDVRGIAGVMSNAASYVLITLGIADLMAATWISTEAGRLLGMWAAGWWAIRAAGQFIVGRRLGDVIVAGWFVVLAAVHVVAAVA
jgi:hypothetical protein